MKTPHLSIAIFKSRIGKRIFWMFVFCSLLPIITLSALSYVHVERHLSDQTIARLRQMTKSTGMSIYERLELLEKEIRLVGHTLSSVGIADPDAVSGSQSDQRPDRFQSLAFLTDDGWHIPLLGEMDPDILLTEELKRMPASGKSFVHAIPQDNAPARITLGFRTSVGPNTKGILLGEVNANYLWGIGQQYNLPPLTELTIIDQTGRVLISSLQAVDELIRRASSPGRDTASHHFDWQNDEHLFMASYWDLFLKSRFSTGTWTIVLSQTRDDALAVLRSFKFDFPLSLLIGFWVILLFSIRFIRKSLAPLGKLQEGTRRIHDGNFNQPVEVDSDDEFEDLATSFNTMTQRLSRTFGELSVMAEMGHFVTTRPEVVDLIRTELQIMAAKLDFDWGLMMVQGHVLSAEDVIVGFGMPGQTTGTAGRLDDQPELRQVMDHTVARREILFARNDSEIAAMLPDACMHFLRKIACQSLLCVPLTYESMHMGAIIVGRTQASQPLTESDQHLIVSIAAQTAMALNNTLSFHRLEESEARFRQAFDHAATGIALVTPDRRFRVTNRYFQVLLGYSEEELHGQSLDDLAKAAEHDNNWDILSQMASGEQAFAQFELEFRHKDGHTIWTRINGSLMKDMQDSPLYFIFHIRDLTTERAAERDKRRLEIQLRQAQKMEAIGTLAGGIAHDFNNILSAVGGYTDLAMMRLPDDDSRLRNHLTNVKTATERATDLVRQILAFSRQSDQKRMPLAIGSIVKEALQLLRASLPATIAIRKKIAASPMTIMADPTQVHQIVMNLCTNALHAMQDQGGTLEVRLEPVRVSMAEGSSRLRLDSGDYIKLTIADTGCGMDKRTLERIFDPYFTTKGKGKGTGLGLSVVHGIVENHGGAIEVSSKQGKGTIFDIYFPVAQQQKAQRRATQEGTPGGTERVLFIDDEPMLVDIAVSSLAKLGYQVSGMTDPQAALELFQTKPDQFDLVITDLTMPGITGDRLAQKLKSIRPDLPILLCSGYLKRIGAHSALAGTISKPITLERLTQAIRRVLDE